MIRSRTDYLLGTDRSLFRNMAVRDPRHNSDHYMVVGQLRRGTAWEHVRYIKRPRRLPLLPPKEPTREDKLFEDLQRAVPKPHEREKHRNAWISDETWRLADERVLARRGARVRARLRRLGRAVRASLKGDRRQRVEDAGKDVEALLGEDPPNAKEAWRWMKGWYLTVQLNSLRRDPLKRSSSGRRTSVCCSPVPSLHPPPLLFRVWGFFSQ